MAWCCAGCRGCRCCATTSAGWLRNDIVAGLVLTAVLVPVGMAYAEASGLPPITGLYATIVPLTIYAIFGPSRILVLGPDSSLAGIIAAVVLPLAGGRPGAGLALAGMLSIITGHPVYRGRAPQVRLYHRPAFEAGALWLRQRHRPDRHRRPAAQALRLLHRRRRADRRNARVRSGSAGRKTNRTALVIGVASLAVILGCKRWLPRIPGVLVAVVGATLVVGVFDLRRAGGPVRRRSVAGGAAAVHDSERLGLRYLALLAGAVGIALVSFADTSVLSRTFALRGGYEVDPNQELVALGAANVGSGLFQGFAVSSSASRTPVAAEAGARRR